MQGGGGGERQTVDRNSCSAYFQASRKKAHSLKSEQDQDHCSVNPCAHCTDGMGKLILLHFLSRSTSYELVIKVLLLVNGENYEIPGDGLYPLLGIFLRMGCNTLGMLLNSVIPSSTQLYCKNVFCEKTSVTLSHMYFGHEDYKNKI